MESTTWLVDKNRISPVKKVQVQVKKFAILFSIPFASDWIFMLLSASFYYCNGKGLNYNRFKFSILW
jgi:hypothetical protein